MFVILDQPIERVNEAAAVEISGTSRRPRVNLGSSRH